MSENSDSNKSNHLIEESILPITNKKRTVGMLGYFFIWVGIVVMIVAYQLAGKLLLHIQLP